MSDDNLDIPDFLRNQENLRNEMIAEIMETLAVFDTSKYTRTTAYIKQEAERIANFCAKFDCREAVDAISELDTKYIAELQIKSHAIKAVTKRLIGKQNGK